MKTLVYLAPLAGITDTAMRQICLENAPCLTFTEMVSANGLFYKSKKTGELLSVSPLEKDIGVQLFGSDAARLADIAQQVAEDMGEKLREININMGCPAPKIVKNGEGAALMLDMKKASGIISRVSLAVKVPLTVKFRRGFYMNDDIAADFAKMCEDAGAKRLYIHGRTREQYYTGKSDRKCIAQAKKACRIPVIANGDIFSAEDAADILEETGCDGIMVARGALGNPFIFAEIDEFFKTGKIPPVPSAEKRAQAFLRQLSLSISEKGERLAIRQMRKHAAYYLKGGKNTARLRALAVRAETEADFERVFDEYVRGAEQV